MLEDILLEEETLSNGHMFLLTNGKNIVNRLCEQENFTFIIRKIVENDITIILSNYRMFCCGGVPRP